MFLVNNLAVTRSIRNQMVRLQQGFLNQRGLGPNPCAMINLILETIANLENQNIKTQLYSELLEIVTPIAQLHPKLFNKIAIIKDKLEPEPEVEQLAL